MTFDARFVSDLRQLSSREALEIRAHEKQPRRVALFEIEMSFLPQTYIVTFMLASVAPTAFRASYAATTPTI